MSPRSLLPGMHLLDSGYVDSELLVSARTHLQQLLVAAEVEV